MSAIDKIKSNISKIDNVSNDNYNVLEDPKYVRMSMPLIVDSLEKGCDVMQLENGDIMITEVKTITLHYEWDNKKNKMVRSTANRNKRARKEGKNPDNNFDLDIEEDISEEEFV